MITAKLIICAEGIIQDVTTDKLSLFNILEHISAVGFPAFIPQFQLLMYLERETDDPDMFEIEFRVTLNNMELVKRVITADFQGKVKNRIMIRMNGLTVPAPGTIQISAFHKEKQLGDYAIVMEMVGPVTIEAHSAE